MCLPPRSGCPSIQRVEEALLHVCVNVSIIAVRGAGHGGVCARTLKSRRSAASMLSRMPGSKAYMATSSAGGITVGEPDGSLSLRPLDAQHAIITCMDSRVHPERVFGLDIGDAEVCNFRTNTSTFIHSLFSISYNNIIQFRRSSATLAAASPPTCCAPGPCAR